MNILFVAASADRLWGGPVTAIESLAPRLAKLSSNVTIVAPRNRNFKADQIEVPGVTLKTFQQNAAAKIWTGFSVSMHRWLSENVKTFDLVHVHELWHFPHWSAIHAARKTGTPYVVTPHGELNPPHLKIKRLKKNLFLKLFERKALKNAAAIQVLTDLEAGFVGSHVEEAGTVTIPNGSDHLSGKVSGNQPDPPWAWDSRIAGDELIILFVGRLHQTKGVNILLAAMKQVLSSTQRVHLVIAGPDSDGSRQILESFVASDDSLKNKVTFTGELTHSEVAAAMSSADLFVSPSLAEGFSFSILEALSFGLPVVITNNCNFDEVATAKAGYVVPADENEIANAIGQLVSDDELRSETAKKAMQLSDNYLWDNIAQRINDMYQSILAGEHQPT